MPRAFSSGRRSVSTPVSALTSARLAVVDVAGGADDHGARDEPRELLRRMPASSLEAAQVEHEARRRAIRPITGTGSARSARGQRRRERASGGADRASAPAPALGSSSTGSAPLPIWLAHSRDRRPSMPARARRRHAGGSRCASAAISARGRVSRRSVGSRAAQPVRVGDRAAAPPRARPASSCRAAARASADCSRMRAIERPRGRRRCPACGPPSSLSPLKVTRSAPARDALARRSARAAGRSGARSTSAPLPRSSTTGTPCARAERGELAPARPRR